MNQQRHDATRETGPEADCQAPEIIPVAELLRHRGSVWLEHRGERYLLRITRNGKLILTK